MKLGSLCTGYGGLDMAVSQFFNAETVWVADNDKHVSNLLAHRYPTIPNLGDLTVIDWSTVESVDIICGGYPCQPFSHAGSRKGTKDERHIWPFIADAIRHVRPTWCVFENVGGHLSLGLGDVLKDLAEMGYDTRWGSLRASDAGACHQRLRVFIVGFATDSGGE